MSLHEKAILIDLTLNGIALSKADPGITADVLLQKSATKDAGHWTSKLWTKPALAEITAHDRATRAYHLQKTLPWLDNSKRVLPSSRFMDYMAHFRTVRLEREQLVTDFLDHYDYWVAEAQGMRQGAFRADDYPGAPHAKERFNFSIDAEPIPHKDDFRIQLAGPDLDEIQEGMEKRLKLGAQIARNDLIRRITTPLAHMVERLAEQGGTFRDSLISNVREIANSIPDLNVTEDPEIDAVRQQILDKIVPLDPTVIRESASDRSRALGAASDILSVMAPWLEESEAAAAA